LNKTEDTPGSLVAGNRHEPACRPDGRAAGIDV